MQFSKEMIGDLEEYERTLTNCVVAYVAMRMDGSQNDMAEVVNAFGTDFDRKLQELVYEGMITSAGDDGVLTEKGLAYFYAKLKEMFEEEERSTFEAGCAAYELKLTFLFEDLNVWRTIKVPCDITFDELHAIIQATVGWLNYHAYEFSIQYRDLSTCALKVPEDERVLMYNVAELMFAVMFAGTLDDERDPRDVRLSEVVPKLGQLLYVYDYGDTWEIEITCVGTSTLEDGVVVCTGGEGDAPCEDVGGESGFEEFLRIMGDPDDPEHEDMKLWAFEQGFTRFDIGMTNARLAAWRNCVTKSPISSPNDRYHRLFLRSLDEEGLSDKTRNAHGRNIEHFLFGYLDRETGMGAPEGIEMVPDFLGDYWLDTDYDLPSISAYKSMISSLKKFYKCLLDNGEIERELYRDMLDSVKANQQDWFDFIKKNRRVGWHR